MTDAYMKKRTSQIPDLVALAASAAFVSKALAALCQASVGVVLITAAIVHLVVFFIPSTLFRSVV